MPTPEEVVDLVYAAVFAGDPEQALRHCAPDEQWYAVTPLGSRAGSYPVREYLTEILPTRSPRWRATPS